MYNSGVNSGLRCEKLKTTKFKKNKNNGVDTNDDTEEIKRGKK